jgi:hypothetical protein
MQSLLVQTTVRAIMTEAIVTSDVRGSDANRLVPSTNSFQTGREAATGSRGQNAGRFVRQGRAYVWIPALK